MAPLAHPLVALVVVATLPLAAACGKKKPDVVADAGEVVDAGAAPAAQVLTPAGMKARLTASCGAPDRCACVQQRLAARYSDAALAVLSAEALEAVAVEIDDECTLRSGKLRDGVLATCMDGDEGARNVCSCATDAFLQETSTTVLHEIMGRGWDRDTTNALMFEKVQCGKNKAEAQ